MDPIPIDSLTGAQQAAGTTAQSLQNATDAFGLGFDDLLRIVLTQLTYQDPLKPMDNFEFVSQLAQFSQIQQTQEMAANLQTLVAAQSTSQAAGLLGKIVDVPAGEITVSGRVGAVAFVDGVPRLTIQTADGRTISNIALSSVSQIREAN